MPLITEFMSAMIGAFKLAKRDASGLQYFNQTIEGFWRSFLAILLVAPIELVSDLSGRMSAAEGVGDSSTTSVLSGLPFLLIIWLAFPIAMAFMTRLLGLSHRYVPYIVAYNWCSIPLALLQAPVHLAAASGLLSDVMVGMLYMVLLTAAAYYLWFIAFAGLQTSRLTATGIVIFDILLSYLLLFAFLWATLDAGQSSGLS